MNPRPTTENSSGRWNAETESSGALPFQFDNARKRAIRVAKEQSEQGLVHQREKEIPASPQIPVQPELQAGHARWIPPIPAPTPSVSGPPPFIVEGLRPPKQAGSDRNRPISWSGPSSTQSAEGTDVLEERKKDREERQQERREREQERAVRVRELQEREREREERRKEREERQVEREERRREGEERVRLAGFDGLENASAKRILDLELKNEALNSKVDTLTNQLKLVKESLDEQFRLMKQALETEQKKVNALVEYTKLFQFPDEKVADLNRLQSVVSVAQQKLATLTNLTPANWWLELGPSKNTKDRYEKALQLLKQHKRPDPNTMAFLQNEEAMAYVVEYSSRIGGQRNHDYTTFGKFPREVYANSWRRLNQSAKGSDSILGSTTTFNALLDFIFQVN